MKHKWAACIVSLLSTFLGTPARAADELAPGQSSALVKEAHEIGVEAYTYLYPLVTMDVTRKQFTNVAERDDKVLRAPMNTFVHARTFPSADFKGVVRPNFDTLYSSAWLDLSKEPMIVSAPDTGGRYYLLPMLDMWTDVFAVPGKRTTGTKAGNFAVVAPGWQGQLPDGVERIQSPTPYIWIIGRTQTNGPKDYDAVHKIQDGYKITPLSQWGKEPEPVKGEVDPKVDMKTPPLEQVNKMPAADYFQYGLALMAANAPHLTDQAINARMRRIGLIPDGTFDFAKLDPAVQQALKQAAEDGLKVMKEKTPTLARVVNGWQMNTDTMGVYGNYYLKRAIVALVGLGANQPEDAVYPFCLTDGKGKPLLGDNKYVLHFAKDQLPPAGAFWSVTMYDEQGFPVANSLNRFALGDRDPMKYNADGSLDIYMQNINPGADKEANWLPAPGAPMAMTVTMRIYAPKLEVLTGAWVPPAVNRTK